MNHDMIIIKNAKTHNLKNVSLEIPRNKLVVFTGVSGSGKSSLVFDTIYTESQRQLIETFSSFARSRMPKLSKPDVDEIKNISTAIVIDQKRMGTTLRSTVGTATELYTYLRLLFSRCGDVFIGPSFVFGFNHPLGMCPDCKGLGKKIKVDINQLIARKLERIYLGKAPEEPSAEIKNAYQKYFIYSDCDSCHGSRINEKARSVKVNGKTIPELVNIEFIELAKYLDTVDGDMTKPMISKMKQILSHLIEIGVGYLSLNRPVATLC